MKNGRQMIFFCCARCNKIVHFQHSGFTRLGIIALQVTLKAFQALFFRFRELLRASDGWLWFGWSWAASASHVQQHESAYSQLSYRCSVMFTTLERNFEELRPEQMWLVLEWEPFGDLQEIPWGIFWFWKMILGVLMEVACSKANYFSNRGWFLDNFWQELNF